MKRSILLGCALLLGACGSAQTYTVAAVPVPAYLNSEIPASVPKLVSVDEDFSSRDKRRTSSSSSYTATTKTTTYSWSKENYMASQLWEASKEIYDEDGQPVVVSGEFQAVSKFAAGDTYDDCWFSGHLTQEKE